MCHPCVGVIRYLRQNHFRFYSFYCTIWWHALFRYRQYKYTVEYHSLRDCIKNFRKKFEKILCSEKNILFSKIFENCFLENKIFENWSMAVRIWLFFDQLQRLITQICVTQKKHLMPLKDITHQHLWPEI